MQYPNDIFVGITWYIIIITWLVIGIREFIKIVIEIFKFISNDKFTIKSFNKIEQIEESIQKEEINTLKEQVRAIEYELRLARDRITRLERQGNEDNEYNC